MTARLHRLAVRAAMLAGGTTAALLVAEGGLRVAAPHAGLGAAEEMAWFREGDDDFRGGFVLDPELGVRLAIGDGHTNEFGTRVNAYPRDKRPGVQRTLFMGDSVTYRGRIMGELRRLYGEEHVEYWNGGVESYNTVQEVGFFARYTRPLHPDHVVLSFHNNDFGTTPVAFEQNGRPVVYAPRRPAHEVNPWLFRRSRLYRLGFGIYAGFAGAGVGPDPALVAETRHALQSLVDMLRSDGARLTVVILPVFAPPAEWTAEERANHAESVRLFASLGLRTFDLRDVLVEAARDGILLEEKPGDRWHPSSPLARRFAAHLKSRALLEGP